MAFRLTLIKDQADQLEALESSTISRWLFVEDGDKRLVLDLRPNPKTEQLSHETLLISMAPDVEQGRIEVRRVTRDAGGLQLAPAKGWIVAQLRAPFAEHVLALAGQHLSRVGTDYYGVPPRHFRVDVG